MRLKTALQHAAENARHGKTSQDKTQDGEGEAGRGGGSPFPQEGNKQDVHNKGKTRQRQT